MDRIEKRLSTSYKEIRGQLIVRPLNYSLHIRDLKGCVYKKISDFVLALYQVLSDTGSSLATSKIRRDELKKWGMEEQEEKVIEDALENTARLYPACVYDKRIGCEVDFLKTDISRDDITFFSDHILLSTFRTTNGATALFYPGVREKMMDIMGGAFVAVFMNTNDVMIFDKKDPAAYRFLETAKHSSDIGEMLSGRLYLCEGNDIAAGYVVKIYEDGEATVE